MEGIFSIAKKGQTLNSYSEEFKHNAVMKYVNGSKSYKVLSKELGIRYCSQLKVWVENWNNGFPYDERKGEQALEDYIYHYNYKRRQNKLKKRASI